MIDPIELELAKLRSHADQLRSFIRDTLREMDRGEVLQLFKVCAKGELSGIDERTAALVARMALVSFFSLFEGQDAEGD
ncbi:MAG: hypothetical protein H7210_02525 [Pyrinomonadaceae bacterium]|nr:hypothetical protein [Phycisphaerales bacterium]